MYLSSCVWRQEHKWIKLQQTFHYSSTATRQLVQSQFRQCGDKCVQLPIGQDIDRDAKKRHTLCLLSPQVLTLYHNNLKNNGDNNSIKNNNNNNNNITSVPFSSGRLVEQWSTRCQLQKRGSLFNYWNLFYILSTHFTKDPPIMRSVIPLKMAPTYVINHMTAVTCGQNIPKIYRKTCNIRSKP